MTAPFSVGQPKAAPFAPLLGAPLAVRNRRDPAADRVVDPNSDRVSEHLLTAEADVLAVLEDRLTAARAHVMPKLSSGRRGRRNEACDDESDDGELLHGLLLSDSPV